MKKANDKHSRHFYQAVSSSVSSSSRGVSREVSSILRSTSKLHPIKRLSNSRNDPLESQAHQVADRVAKGHRVAPGVLRPAQVDHDMKPSSSLSLRMDASQGKPLPLQERKYFESRMGASFADVRLHQGQQATQLNRALGARAFTRGTDVFVNEGQYSPGTEATRELLAHELSHVVQQQGKQGVVQCDDWPSWEDVERWMGEAGDAWDEGVEAGEREVRELIAEGEQLVEAGREEAAETLDELRQWGGEQWESIEQQAGEVYEYAEEWGPEHARLYSEAGTGDIQRLEFDGSEARLIGTTTLAARAISGLMPGHPNIAAAGLPSSTDCTQPQYQHIPNVGPIPEGAYYLRPGDVERVTSGTGGWGHWRTRLIERPDTEIRRRASTERDGGFYLHQDANHNGTAGCIGLWNHSDNVAFHREIRANSAPIPVVVSYSTAASDENAESTESG